MKIYKILSIVFAVAFLHSCKQAQTLSPCQIFYLSIEKPEAIDKLDLIIAAGSAKVVKSERKSILYKVTLDEVRGGYSELFGKKFNINDGLESDRIEIINNGNLIKTLSFNELTSLNSNQIDTILSFKIKSIILSLDALRYS